MKNAAMDVAAAAAAAVALAGLLAPGSLQ